MNIFKDGLIADQGYIPFSQIFFGFGQSRLFGFRASRSKNLK